MAHSDLDHQTAASGTNRSTASVIAVIVAAVAVALIVGALYMALPGSDHREPVDILRLSGAERLELVQNEFGDHWRCDTYDLEPTRNGESYGCGTENAEEVRKLGGRPENGDWASCDVTLSRDGYVTKRCSAQYDIGTGGGP